MRGEKRRFASSLLRWYDRAHRDLPWRRPPGSTAPLDPYRVLLSEAMLQQTQVETVIPYFLRFLAEFPTVFDLARADEQKVLRLWQGLGYYSRARNLHAAAKRIVAEHAGVVPSTVEALLSLPGVGRYTAGAVASIAFDVRAPILDGNVARVLARIDCIQNDPRETETQQTLWRRAEETLPNRRPGDFNSAMMELGATVCTPRAPKCLICPVKTHCEALAAGLQEQIPPPKKAKPSPLIRRQIFRIRRGRQFLIEQRPATGRWAGMWQFVTLEAENKPTPSLLRKAYALQLTQPRSIGKLTHVLTHRRYQFDVYTCDVQRDGRDPSPRRWLTLAELDDFPLPRPHVKVATLLREQASR